MIETNPDVDRSLQDKDLPSRVDLLAAAAARDAPESPFWKSFPNQSKRPAYHSTWPPLQAPPSHQGALSPRVVPQVRKTKCWNLFRLSNRPRDAPLGHPELPDPPHRRRQVWEHPMTFGGKYTNRGEP